MTVVFLSNETDFSDSNSFPLKSFSFMYLQAPRFMSKRSCQVHLFTKLEEHYCQVLTVSLRFLLIDNDVGFGSVFYTL